MDRVRFITHQGKQILLVDLTDCNAEEVTTIVRFRASEIQRTVKNAPFMWARGGAHHV